MPDEPTEEMITAGAAVLPETGWFDERNDRDKRLLAEEVFKAMMAAKHKS